VNGPRLNWGLLATFEPRPARRVPLDLSREWQVAGESLNLVARPVPRLELVGRLSGDPGRIRSNQAKANFPGIFALAVAAATAAEPLRSHSRATAINALRAWAQVYRPTGNPIDEWFFVPLLQAVDLIGDDEPLRGWAGEFAAGGDRFYAGRADRNPSRANNWMARRLLIRTVAATVTGDDAARAETPALLEEFVARNYATAERDGRTVDFMQRDALHYHVAAVQPLTEIVLYAPDLAGPQVRAAVLSGLEFIRPFFLGQAEHIEFARTANSFDRERRDDGNPVFQHAPWDPQRGRVLLRLARAAFPEIRGWTEQIVDHRYDPRTKLLAAIYGEPQRTAEWD
jgi:Alginate lyase